MSINHLPQPDLALYVLGTLEPTETARLEEHVAVCASCAAALAAEAQLEVQLQLVVPVALRELPALPIAVRPLPLVGEPPAPRRRWPVVAMMAASLVVVVGLTLARVKLPLPPSDREAALAALAIGSPAELFSEWSPEAGPLQCGLPGSGLVCASPPPEPPAVLREAAFSTAASWLTSDSGERFTPITSACYAPR